LATSGGDTSSDVDCSLGVGTFGEYSMSDGRFEVVAIFGMAQCGVARVKGATRAGAPAWRDHRLAQVRGWGVGPSYPRYNLVLVVCVVHRQHRRRRRVHMCASRWGTARTTVERVVHTSGLS
jgi:hypothetical protein